MQGADQGQATAIDGRDLRIGIVQARFNAPLTNKLAEACLAELQTLGVAAKHIKLVSVPGALEVPMALLAMAESNDFDALVEQAPPGLTCGDAYSMHTAPFHLSPVGLGRPAESVVVSMKTQCWSGAVWVPKR